MDLERPSRAAIRQWGKLLIGKYRRRERMFLAEGRKVVDELLTSPWGEAASLLCEEGKEREWGDLSGAPGKREHTSTTAYLLTREEWRRLSQDRESEGVMAVVRMEKQPEWQEILHLDTGDILMLDRINNPSNLGAMMRSAHWFGFSSVFLSADTADWTHPKTVRASMGSLFHLDIVAGLDFRILLPVVGSRCLLVGSDVRTGTPPRPTGRRTALLLGSESHGLPEEFLKQTAETWCIPGAGGAESLSVAQAAAIMMYEIHRGRSRT